MSKPKVCKCGHDKDEHKKFPFRHCKNCPCTTYFKNTRPTKVDQLLLGWMGMSAGLMIGLALWFTQGYFDYNAGSQMFEEATYLITGMFLWFIAIAFLIYHIETVVLPLISQTLRKDYSKTL